MGVRVADNDLPEQLKTVPANDLPDDLTPQVTVKLDYEPKTLAGFGENVLSSAGRFAGDIGQAMVSAPGLLYQGATQPKQFAEAAIEAAKGVPDYIMERYGGVQKALDTLYKDPVGFAADLSTVFGGAGALAKAGKLGKLAEGLSTASKIVDPLAQAGRAVRAPAAAAGRALGLPKRLYSSALGPSTRGEKGIERARKNVAIGLREEIPVSAAGEKTAEEIITDMQNKVNAQIAGIPAGSMADPIDLAIGAEAEVRGMKKFKGPKKAVHEKKLQKTLDEFLEGHQQPMTPAELQEFKQGGYEDLGSTKYSKRQKVGPETEKQILRMAKEQLESWAPDLEKLNEREGAVIALKQDLKNAVERVNKRQMLGIGPAIAAEVGHTMGGTYGAYALAALKIAMDQPNFKSKLAFAINKAQHLKASKLTKLSTAVRATED